MSKVVDNTFTIGVLVIIAVIAVFGAMTILPQMRQAWALDAELRELEENCMRTERQIAKLQSNQRRFREDPRFLEELARERQRVYPGELVFVFDDSQ